MGSLGPTGHGHRAAPPRPLRPTGELICIQCNASAGHLSECPSRTGFDWTNRPWSDVSSRTILVDSVAYTAPRVRQIVQERHQLAEENRRLRATVDRQQTHLHRRTAALVRLIARKGPRL